MSGSSRDVAAGPEPLTGLLEPVITAAGLELESIAIGRAGRRSLLRVVVDAENGVSTDDIALVSRAVAAQIDASDAMGTGAYTLEVSSPGVDRPLTEPRHWRRATGRLVRVSVVENSVESRPRDATPSSSLTADADQSRTIEGRVAAAGPSGVTLEVDGGSREFGYAELGPGQVQVEFNHASDWGKFAHDGTDLAGVQPDGH